MSHKWTDGDIALLRERAGRLSVVAIAGNIGVTPRAVADKASRLGVSLKRTEQEPYPRVEMVPGGRLSIELQQEIAAARAERAYAPPFDYDP